MGQFSKVLLVIDKVHTVPQTALDCWIGFLVPTDLVWQNSSNNI